MFDCVKKTYELPLFSNHSLVYTQPGQVNKAIKLVEGKQIPKLTPPFYDIQGLRTVTFVDNLAKCENLRKLTHPVIYSP